MSLETLEKGIYYSVFLFKLNIRHTITKKSLDAGCWSWFTAYDITATVNANTIT